MAELLLADGATTAGPLPEVAARKQKYEPPKSESFKVPDSCQVWSPPLAGLRIT
ncbi:hypothetical protein K0M31_014063 [Melipona bicolor]|uniref:Uncharacterized protein n=1 Tax=Melipona bicolor TaxID=60889 RepID=A0AA40G7V4_9HYME|nr:hypothetical protein K0M31_014063 [Melipona bicolor]